MVLMTIHERILNVILEETEFLARQNPPKTATRRGLCLAVAGEVILKSEREEFLRRCGLKFEEGN